MLAIFDMFERDQTCMRLIRNNLDWAVFFFLFIFNEKQTSSHNKMRVTLRDFTFFTTTILQLQLEALSGLFEGYLFEILLLGFFGCWLFIINRMKPNTVKQKIRDVVSSGVIGLPMDFKSVTLDKFCKGLRTFSGSYQSDKRPLTLPVLMHALPLIPWESRMAAQVGFSSHVALFGCLRRSEYTVSDSVTPNKFLTNRKVLYPVEKATTGKGNICFHEDDWERNND